MKFIIKLFPEIIMKSDSVHKRFVKILTGNIKNTLLPIDPNIVVVHHWDFIEVKSKDEVWNISSCYPYVEKDKHKLASSKAFVMASAFQNSIIDILKEALLADSSDGFSDDW